VDVKRIQMTKNRKQNITPTIQPSPSRGEGKGGGGSPGYIFVKPGMSPREMVQAVRSLKGVCFTSVGMRDAGQSDYKNRHRIYDLATLAPFYNRMGLFSSECLGGARWHVGVMYRRVSPF